MRYKFIREHRQEYSIKRMCQVLSVTRSGYYAWQPEKTGLRALENQILVEQIQAEHHFTADLQHLSITGLCAACQDNAKG